VSDRVEEIIKLLKAETVVVRRAAARALREIKDTRAVELWFQF
jgi:HEAT repeat protein